MMSLKRLILGVCLLFMVQAQILDTALAGSSWLLQTYGSEDAPQSVLENAPITLEVDALGQQVAGKAGCNSYSGALSLDGTTFRVSAPISTMMACSETTMNQEATYLRILGNATTFELTGTTLTLLADDERLEFISASSSE
jgi:heat shock protein HslJ